MICMQRSAHSCEICVELLAGISVLEYAFYLRHNNPLSINMYMLRVRPAPPHPVARPRIQNGYGRSYGSIPFYEGL